MSKYYEYSERASSQNSTCQHCHSNGSVYFVNKFYAVLVLVLWKIVLWKYHNTILTELLFIQMTETFWKRQNDIKQNKGQQERVFKLVKAKSLLCLMMWARFKCSGFFSQRKPYIKKELYFMCPLSTYSIWCKDKTYILSVLFQQLTIDNGGFRPMKFLTHLWAGSHMVSSDFGALDTHTYSQIIDKSFFNEKQSFYENYAIDWQPHFHLSSIPNFIKVKAEIWQKRAGNSAKYN